jgi:hypothetical protein
MNGSVVSAAMERARVRGSAPVAHSIEVWKAAQELPLSGRRMTPEKEQYATSEWSW